MFIKLSLVKMSLFVISFVFGQTLELSIFAEICRFHLNLPCSYYNRHLSRFPSLSPYLSFFQTFVGFLPKFANFAKFVIFVKPTIIDMPLLSSCFNFYQTYKFFNFWSKDQLTKKKDRILIKDLISNNWKYKTKEGTLILQSRINVNKFL